MPSKQSRRAFLGGVAGLTAGLAGCTALGEPTPLVVETADGGVTTA